MLNRAHLRRTGTAVAMIAAAGALGACSDTLLEVENPASIGTEYLDQITSIPALTNTIVSDFNRMFAGGGPIHYAGAILSDEAITGHNFTQWQEFDRRIVLEENSLLDDIYEPVQIARGTGELVLARLRTLVANPGSSPRIAQSLAYLGYDYVLLGENFCSAPITPKGAALSSEELFEIAIAKFDTAIAVAQAGTGDSAATAVLSRANIINLARVGAARAALNRGEFARAAAYASLVPTSFVHVVAHGEANGYQNNPFQGATQGTNRNLGVSVHFRDITNDPRVRWESSRTGHNTRTVLFTPRPPPSFVTDYAATGSTTFSRGGNLRVASGLEAQYILAEAQGPTAANITFINSRRAIGNMAALPATVSAADFRAAVMEQRRRDFFLDGHRLGDIRRYLKLYNVDFFPTGTHEDAAYGTYGTATCFIPHQDERTGQAP